MPADNIKQLLLGSIEDISDLYRKKEVSPVEVTASTLERLEKLEPQLNAFITVLSDQALEQARAAESMFAKGEKAGRLLGIPVSLKDIFMTKGIRTSLGSRVMKNYIPDEDAFVYKALKDSGAVIFGKTNMLEFAYGSVHPDYGKCNNPWDLTRTAGGSSTGSAASIAAGIGFASIGTDTGGSLRAPASFCGIVGLKPTYETVSRQGLFPLSRTLDHIGPLTRTVRDNAIILEHISSRTFHLESIFSGDIRGMKIGVIRSLTETISNSEVAFLINGAIDQLKELGAIVEVVEVPGIEKAEEAALPLVLAEAAAVHKQWYGKREADYYSATYANLTAGQSITAINYLEALENRKKFAQAVDEALQQVEVLMSPTIAFPATELDPSFETGNTDGSRRTIPFNYTGHPAISISAGNTASQNLPVGLQLIAGYHDEETLYRVADAYQQASGGYKAPPL